MCRCMNVNYVYLSIGTQEYKYSVGTYLHNQDCLCSLLSLCHSRYGKFVYHELKERSTRPKKKEKKSGKLPTLDHFI